MEREALVTKTNAFKLVFIANCVKMAAPFYTTVMVNHYGIML